MASAGEADRVAAAARDDSTDPLVDEELKQESSTDFPPNENLKKEKGEAEREEKKEGMEKLKSSLVVSGLVIAVIGAIFALAKKIKKA